MAVGREIILVPGLWYGPRSMALIGARMRRPGYNIRFFSYRSTKATAEECADGLAELVRKTPPGAPPHMVGHSLGGLLILRLLAMSHALPIGRVVLLGTPMQGSEAARKTLQLPGGAALLGVAATTLCAGSHGFRGNYEVGMIAGSRAFGLGRIAGFMGKASDGTVALEETYSECLTARITLPVNHTGMLFSSLVAREIACFLEQGQFLPDQAADQQQAPLR
jgi:pimeloyl-ACP methyl ester carboxylesterase